MTIIYVEVVFALPVNQSYTYSVPDALTAKVKVGVRVLAPLGRQQLTGFVVRTRQRRPSTDFELKPVSRFLDDEPVFSLEMLRFTRKLADWYFASWGEMLQAALPPALTVRSRTRFALERERLNEEASARLSEGEKTLVQALKNKAYAERYLRNRFSGLDVGLLLQRLERKGLVSRVREFSKPPAAGQTSSVSPSVSQLELDFSLDRETLRVVRSISRLMTSDEAPSPVYLHAPEQKRHAAYLHLLKQCSRLKRRALVLVPEIALTGDLLKELQSKSGEQVAVLHSRLTPAQRTAAWQRIRGGQADVVLGPRSALFAPLENLGLVIVDEEQDFSYVQRENPVYDARRGALIRARQTGALLLYGSGWPAVSTRFRMRRQDEFYSLPDRPQQGFVEILDDSRTDSLISPRIVQRIRRRLETKQEPVLVFCSRRGYASFLVCTRCRRVARCRSCDISLAYHKKSARLLCHYCGRSQEDTSCPECGGRLKGSHRPGIEVYAEKLQKLFPGRSVVSFDRDETGPTASQDRILDEFGDGRIDILLGTPYLAHRLQLPPAGLVAVFQPESALGGSDFLAGQRTAQNLRQVIRFVRPRGDSELLIQTAFPQHHCIRPVAFGHYDDFYAQEIHYRKTLNYPPLTYLAEVVFQGENLRTLAGKTRSFAKGVLDTGARVEVLGPALAPVARLRGKNRVQMIFKSKRKSELDRALQEPLRKSPARRSVRIFS
jgi:primosomal protein N' (replication factor Y)